MSTIYRFGVYELDGETRELRRKGAEVRLQAQPAQVLAYLVAHRGEIVTREQLRQLLWGSDTFVDFDRGLNFCISQIRSALRDDAANPTFIRTIPKQGYQFICPVELNPGQEKELSEVGLSESGLPSTVQVAESNRHARSPLGFAPAKAVFGAVALLIICATAFFFAWRRNSQHPTVAVVRFDNETGDSSLDSFADALTDNVVEQLAASGGHRYGVIGNAKVLRVSRDQRDLNSIGRELHASIVIVGQVQRQGDKIRILAHLIHVPDQTHLWVVRMDRELKDPLDLTSEAARQISSEFSPRIASPRS